MVAKTQTDTGISRGLRWSVILHAGLFISFLIKSLIFPSTIQPYLPSLRVDLVGLPDLLKKDMDRLKTLPLPKSGEPEEAIEEQKSKSKPSAQAPVEEDDLVLNPKKAKPKGKKDTEKEEAADRKSRAQKALARIKALARVNDAEENTAEESAVLKGNQVSKGAALSGEAKESAEQSYYDKVLVKLQANWAIPIWVSRQNLQAQVQVFVDYRGRVKLLQFIKPSGNAQFDQAVKRAVSASEPFPVPPVELRGSLLNRGILLGFPL